MKPEMRALFNDEVLTALAPRYGVAAEDVRFVGGFESFVHAYARDGHARILKITHTLARTPDVLMGELDWLGYMADHGVAVARPVPSLSGALIESLPGPEGTFLAIAYEAAPGSAVDLATLTPALNRAWGRLLGQMHTHTRAYGPDARRAGWRDVLVPEFHAAPPDGHAWFVAHLDGLIERLQALPRTPDAFGLVHGDLHAGNLLWTGETLTAIDFDDAHHTWFANDMAIALYYVVQHARRAGLDAESVTTAFLAEFLAGYAEAHALDPAWLGQFELFLKVRRAVLYAAIVSAYPGDAMPERHRALVADLRQGIEADTPLVDVDFTSFAPLLASAPQASDTVST
jgi:Ser/Thr protein kinase RdoA (MazF antagonist)